MQSSQIQEFIKEIELFKGLDDSELNLIADSIEIKEYEPNIPLFTENSPRKYIYIIYSGEVELYKTSAYGEEKRLSFFRKFDFLGEGALMDDYPHSTSARALIKSVILIISRQKFEALFKEHPQLAAKILSHVARVISRRMRQAATRVVNVAAQYISGRTRKEHDLLGEREVPYEYYYGVQTLRALENFSISGISLTHFPNLIEALAMVKMASAKANNELGLISKPICDAICQACREIINGKWHTHFVVDLIQGGAGTSTNMNANEVIANRALEILGFEKGQYDYCHPLDHVNRSQSTNDVYPTSLSIAIINSSESLVEVLQGLIDSFQKKAKEFKGVIKMGRTQLQDAVPMTLGQTFEAFASTLREEIDRLLQNAELFKEINMGGTAIGTGINADPGFRNRVIKHLCEISGHNLSPAPDLVEASSDTGAFVMYSSAIKRLAVKLSKICNDLRLLSSGPRAGLNEINLPQMQPGSSIMPGKVNPVIPEVVNQIAFKVIGNDLTVTLAAEAGQLELNVMEPIIAQSIFESTEMLKNGMATLKYRCIEGITANHDYCRNQVFNSIGLVTALVPRLGYDICSRLAKRALAENASVYDLVLDQKLLSKEELDRLLDPENMVSPDSNSES